MKLIAETRCLSVMPGLIHRVYPSKGYSRRHFVKYSNTCSYPSFVAQICGQLTNKTIGSLILDEVAAGANNRALPKTRQHYIN